MTVNLSGFKVVIIGGGTGTPILAKALEGLPISRTIIVTAFDTGGSTGELSRKYQTTRAMGDFRRAFAALYKGDSPVWPLIWGLRFRNNAPDFGGRTLAELLRLSCEEVLGKRECDSEFASLKLDTDDRWNELFAYTFPDEFPLSGHVVGNILILACEKLWGRAQGLRNYSDLLKIHGTVLPVSLEDAHVVYEMSDGSTIVGEASITEREPGDMRSIIGIHLDQTAIAYIPVLEALRTADLIIVAMGDLYSSIAPNFAVEFVKEAIRDSTAPLVYFPNLMSRVSETHGYDAATFPEVLLALGVGRSKFDAIFTNTEEAPEPLLNYYLETERSMPVAWDEPHIEKRLQTTSTLVIHGHYLDPSGFCDQLIRHDPQKVRDALLLYIHARQEERIRWVLDLDDMLADTTRTMQGDPDRWLYLEYVPGAAKFLSKYGKDTYVVSYGDLRLQHNKAAVLKLKEYVGERFYVASSLDGKRELLRKIINTFGLNPRRVIVAGDRLDGEIKEGNLLGCPTIQMVRPGGSHASYEPASEDEKPDYRVTDFYELLKLPFVH